MALLKDITGQRFGRLVVTGRAENYVVKTLRPYMPPTTHSITRWICKCDCGNEVVVLGNNLRAGRTTSCGCYAAEYRKAHPPVPRKQPT